MPSPVASVPTRRSHPEALEANSNPSRISFDDHDLRHRHYFSLAFVLILLHRTARAIRNKFYGDSDRAIPYQPLGVKHTSWPVSERTKRREK